MEKINFEEVRYYDEPMSAYTLETVDAVINALEEYKKKSDYVSKLEEVVLALESIAHSEHSEKIAIQNESVEGDYLTWGELYHDINEQLKDKRWNLI